jgi:protein O-mannosyl-transferase
MKSRDPKGAPPPAMQSERRLRDWTVRRRHLLVALGLCLLTLAVYSNSFGAAFAMDNRGLILQDARVRAATAENLDLIFGHTYWWPYGESGLFRPLTTLSYLFNYAILGNGENSAGYHWINFLLHAANVLLVYTLGLRLTSRGPAAWTAALWAVHPVLTESVTNIVGRADLLAGLAVLSGILLYLKSTERPGWGRWATLGALSLTTAAGVFSKESAVMVLPVIVLYEAIWWKERRQALGLVLGSIAMLIPVQAMLYQRAAVLWSSLPTTFPFYDNPIVGAGFVVGKLTALKVMGLYLALLAWPARLSCDYSWAQIPLAGGSVVGSPADWLAWIALAAAAAAGVLLWRGNRQALWLAGAALLVFLPTSNLVFPIGTIMAERFMYLPAIAFAAGVVAAVGALEKRVGDRRLAPALLGLIAVAYGARTWVRNLDWQDDLTVGRAAVEASPASFKSHKLLAYALHEADPGHANIDRVIEESEKGLAPLNALPDSRNNADSYLRTGGYYAERGERLRQSGAAGTDAAGSDAAVKDAAGKDAAVNVAYRRALELLLRSRAIAQAQTTGTDDPARFGGLMLRISEVQRRLGDGGQALAAAVEARRMEPGNAEIHHQTAAILLDEGRADEAAAALMEGVLVTTDTGLRNELLRLYQGGLDRAGCATMAVQGNTALNPACEIVHRHLCAASAGTIRLRLETGRPDLAETMKQTALKDFGCPVEQLERGGVQ